MPHGVPNAPIDDQLIAAARVGDVDTLTTLLDAQPERLTLEAPPYPLRFAVRTNRPEMVALLIDLGADPLATDGSGNPAAVYARTPDADRPVMQSIRALTAAARST